ncbi:MAG TPA: FMN-binding negative transcriptional regulator [Pseudoxanthomonas sp.]
MYTPSAFAETDLAELDHLLARDPFVTLVSSSDGMPFASHLPVLYSREGERVLIEGHWARPNPQARHEGHALMIVHGPHAYMSPSWYADKEEAARVPTWNYAVAHLYGRLEASANEDFLASIVERLSAHHETAVGSDWRYEHDRPDIRSQLRGIIGFRFVPERIELKFKLSQNHPAANVHGAAQGLQRQVDGPANEIATLMLDRLARRQQD